MTGLPAYEFARKADGYRLRIPDVATELEALSLERRRSELHGEIVVRSSLPGVRSIAGVIHHAAYNFSSTRARSELARVLSDRSGEADDPDWLGYLEALCQSVLAAEREGEPAVLLASVEKPAPERFWIEPFLLRDHPTMFFGDGGAMKSYLVLWLVGQLARTVPVLYADFEFSAGDHRDRLERLFGSDMPPHLYYARCDRSLPAEVDRLARIVDQRQIQYGVIDSVGYAGGGDAPEAAETAIRVMQAARRLHIGAALVAHVTKEQGDQKPFGSAFWHNSARSTWYVKRSDEGASESIVTIGLYNRKANTTRRHEPRAFEFTFDDTAWTTTVRPTELAEVDDLAAKMPLRHRIAALVRAAPHTYAELASATDSEAETVRKTIARDKGRTFAKVIGQDGITRFGLRVIEGAAA